MRTWFLSLLCCAGWLTVILLVTSPGWLSYLILLRPNSPSASAPCVRSWSGSSEAAAQAEPTPKRPATPRT
jgi:hypothetical protein